MTKTKTLSNLGILGLFFLALSCSPLAKATPKSSDAKGDKSESKSSESADSDLAKCPNKFKEIDLCVEIKPDKNPISGAGENTFELSFYKPGEGPDTDAYTTLGYSVDTFFRMICCGRTITPSIYPSVSPQGYEEIGIYNLGPVSFESTGKWEFHIRLKEGSKVVDEVVPIIESK